LRKDLLIQPIKCVSWQIFAHRLFNITRIS